jgi:hypothetical protein
VITVTLAAVAIFLLVALVESRSPRTDELRWRFWRLPWASQRSPPSRSSSDSDDNCVHAAERTAPAEPDAIALNLERVRRAWEVELDRLQARLDDCRVGSALGLHDPF